MDKTKVINNFIWRLLERFGAQGVTFIVSVILARLLDPEVYGLIAIVTVITTILQVFVDGGLSNALIQKKDVDNIDFSTVFFFNCISCILIYLLLYIIAPFISRFYEIQELTSIIRALGLLVVISGFKSIQQAYVSKNLLFKKFFFSTLGGTIVAAFVGIIMAYKGFGVWALVAQNLINQTIDTIILWITVGWRPIKVFSKERFLSLFSFGWKFLASGLLTNIYNEIRSLIIGKIYTMEDLAYYNKGQQLPNIIHVNLNASIDSVLFPTLSDAQDDITRIKHMCRLSIKVGSFVTIPVMFGLASVASPIITIVLTEKWLPAVPYLIIFCISGAFYPVQTANLNVINALGRSDIFLTLEIIKKVIDILVIIITMHYGVIWIAAGTLLTCFTSFLVNAWPNRKLLDYNYFDQIIDILPNVVLGIFMWIGVYLIGLLNLNLTIMLIIQIISGVIIYVGGAYLFKFESFNYCLDLTKMLLQK